MSYEPICRAEYIILIAPDGTEWKVKVDNSGVLITEALV